MVVSGFIGQSQCSSTIIEMRYGRKQCDLEFNKNQYIAHIKRLEKIKGDNSPIHRSLVKERKHIDHLIEQSHIIHKIGLQHTLSQRQSNQVLTQRPNYENVKSVVKKEMRRRILKVPSRQKPDQHYREQQNSRMVKKILHARSELRFATLPMAQAYTARTTSRMRTKHDDFSDIYEASRMHTKKATKVHIKVAKGKEKIKVHLRFSDYLQMVGHFKEDTLVSLLCFSRQAVKESNIMTFKQLAASEIYIDAFSSGFTAYLVQKIGNKDIKKFKLSIGSEQMTTQSRKWFNKSLQDSKGKCIGTVECELRRKKTTEDKNDSEESPTAQASQKGEESNL